MMKLNLMIFLLIVLPFNLSAQTGIGEFDYKTIIELIFILVIVVLFFAERRHLINKHKEELEKLSDTDLLTGLASRKKLDETLEFQENNVKRYKSYFSIILMNIDNIKNINDKHGQHIGNTLLQDVSKILSQAVRSSDIVGRWGSDEFMIISAHTNEKNALSLADKLRRRIHMYKFNGVDKATASFGISEHNEDKKSLDELIVNVNRALNDAKKSGRNQCSVH